MHSAAGGAPPRPMTLLSDLPAHVIAEIVGRLPAADALAVAAVCAPARRDEPAWRARAASLAGGAPLGAIADWGDGVTWRALVAGLLARHGHLLAARALSAAASYLGTLVTVEAVPPLGLVAYSLTPVALGAGFHRAPLFEVAFTPAAPASVRCRRPGRPPPGRGAMPDWHAAALWSGDGEGGGGGARPALLPPSSVSLTCVDGCRQSMFDVNARLAAARGADPGAEAAPGGARGPARRAVVLPEMPPLADVGAYIMTMVGIGEWRSVRVGRARAGRRRLPPLRALFRSVAATTARSPSPPSRLGAARAWRACGGGRTARTGSKWCGWGRRRARSPPPARATPPRRPCRPLSPPA